MESFQRKTSQSQTENSCRSPAPNLPSSSSLFRDISNFKTPKHPSTAYPSHVSTPQFFTASKRTPSSAFYSFGVAASRRHRPSMATTTTASKSKANRRLKVLELEQLQSCRRELIKKEKSIKSLASSLTAWLNFLFENPNQCGCGDKEVGLAVGVRSRVGKRESWVRKREEDGVKVDGLGRWPKRQRDGNWSVLGNDDWGNELEISSSQFASLNKSLSDLCSFDDLKGRMREYLSFSTCNEILNVMTRVTKNIDEGRLKMKPHCPLVTDLGLKEKALKALLNYNSAWLRVGLYIIFGGQSLLTDGGSATDEEIGFLKMVIEKQLFCHAGLAKSFAYNKLVEGLYRPGYFEVLGNVILKRFLLLVLLLDKLKTHSSLPIKYGLDGLDGGSPLLFNIQSNIKSSHQMVTDFLITDVMHGEGNLLAHLVMIGYRVSYEQHPLIEYNFRIEDLFQDIQDGVKLCRAIQLLQNDSSVLMKVALPADSYKKRLANCNIALQYLKRAGVSLYDDDGMLINGDDIVNGDKELTLSLLWNVFVHLQIPLLITKTTLYDEICKICKSNSELKAMESSSHLDMLLNWIKAICENYGDKKENLNSLVDGKSMWCLLDFYFHKELTCLCSLKDIGKTSVDESVISSVDSSDAVHNFVLSQKITTLLGNVPQVLQTSDILEYNGPCNNRSVIVLLVFMSTQLLVNKTKDQLNFRKLMGCHCQALERRLSSLDRWSKKSEAKLIKDEDSEETVADAARKFKAVKAWWQEMAKQNSDCIIKPVPPFSFHSPINKRGSTNVCKEKAALVIQTHVRKMSKRRYYLKTKNAVSCLQMYVRAWLTVKHMIRHTDSMTVRFEESQKETENLVRTVDCMLDRHNFVKLKRSTLLIQSAARLMLLRNQKTASESAGHVLETCLIQMSSQEEDLNLTSDRKTENDCISMGLDSQLDEKGFAVCPSQRIENLAVSVIQRHWRAFQARKQFANQKQAVITIQRHCRGCLARKQFASHKHAAITIRSVLRSLSLWRKFNNEKVATRSATVIQSCLRGWLARGDASRRRRWRCIIVIQSNIRCWFARREFLSQKSAAVVIQSSLRALVCSKIFSTYRQAAIEIQRIVRGRITRTRLLGAMCVHSVSMRNASVANSGNQYQRTELQRWWRRTIMFKSQTDAAVVIQSHVRGWFTRKRVARENCLIVLIQASWKGYIVRRDAKGQQLVDLRRRVQESAANVDDGMRLINRHIAALNELLSMKSLSNILRNCATLDEATGLSRNCCEILVEAGAIDILFKQLKSVSRSIPDQEILKHTLSILRNLAHYPHLSDTLINHGGSVETILREMLRNKEEGYFIACDLLKKICMRKKGVEAIHRLPSLFKRLSVLVDELSRKASKEKRMNHHHRTAARKDGTERRLKEAVEILNTIKLGRDFLNA